DWEEPSGEIGEYVAKSSRDWLAAYKVKPLLVEEQAGFESAIAQGGYGKRQIYELVQNGADAMLPMPGGLIEVVLTKDALYCANEGAPVSIKGVDAILGAYLS